MKKSFVLMLAVLTGLTVSAQNSKARVGISGGASISNMFGRANSTSARYNYDSRLGFAAGLFVDMPLGKSKFSFQPGVHYIQKGTTTKNVKTEMNYVALRYAEMSLNILYGGSGKKLNLFGGLGPTISANVPSKFVVKTKPDDTRTETSVVFGKEIPAHYKGMDFGVNGVIGVKSKSGVVLSVNYTLGIRNLMPDDPTVIGNTGASGHLRNASLGIRLGYTFKN